MKSKQEWYRHRKLPHDGTLVVGDVKDKQKWYRDGKLHCGDGPACVYLCGDEYWYMHKCVA